MPHLDAHDREMLASALSRNFARFKLYEEVFWDLSGSRRKESSALYKLLVEQLREIRPLTERNRLFSELIRVHATNYFQGEVSRDAEELVADSTARCCEQLEREDARDLEEVVIYASDMLSVAQHRTNDLLNPALTEDFVPVQDYRELLSAGAAGRIFGADLAWLITETRPARYRLYAVAAVSIMVGAELLLLKSRQDSKLRLFTRGSGETVVHTVEQRQDQRHSIDATMSAALSRLWIGFDTDERSISHPLQTLAGLGWTPTNVSRFGFGFTTSASPPVDDTRLHLRFDTWVATAAVIGVEPCSSHKHRFGLHCDRSLPFLHS